MFRPICSTCQRLSTAAAAVSALGSATATNCNSDIGIGNGNGNGNGIGSGRGTVASRRPRLEQLHAAHVLSKLKDDKST